MEFNAKLIAAIFNFLVLFILLRLVAFKPILKAIDERKRHIEESITSAENLKRDAEALQAKYLEEMKQARQDAQAIIERATKSGEARATEILAEAQQEATRIKNSALDEIKREKDKAVAEVKDQVAVLSIEIAGKLMKQTLDANAQHKLIKEFIAEAGDVH